MAKSSSGQARPRVRLNYGIAVFDVAGGSHACASFETPHVQRTSPNGRGEAVRVACTDCERLPHISNTATARIGEPVPSRHFIGRPMKVKAPAPSSASRLHRLSIWVMPRSKQALCTRRLTLPSGPGRIESMPKCTTPWFASHCVAATLTPEFSVEYSLRGKV